MIDKDDVGLTKRCDFTTQSINTYKQLKERLKEAFNGCLSAAVDGHKPIALASNQIVSNTNNEAPAAFLYNNKLYINPHYYPIRMAGYRDHIEGCLSSPGTTHQVRRWNAIQARYLIIKGHRLQYKTEVLTGFDSQVFQHEIDHLNGITIFH